MYIANESTVKRGAAVFFLLLTALAIVLGVLVARSVAPAGGRPIMLAPMADMPDFVHAAYPDAQTAYRFAHANHGLLTHFPCYCGCVYMGHANNQDCYLQDINEDGEVVFDPHAAGCGICVEITMDVMRLWGDGWQIDDIHAYIVTTYSARGPSTERGA